MFLSETAIRRPVFTTMIIASIVVFGIIAFTGIGVDLFPKVEFPIITVVSVLPGADPLTVESTVTDPIEQAISTIASLKRMRSTSTDGVSQVILEFELEKNVDIAYQEVTAKLGTARSQLPQDLEDPVVEKFDVDATPILAVVVSAPMKGSDLTHLADKVIRERLQKVRNVGQVKLVGGQDRKIWLWLDREKLEGFKLTVQDVEQALRTEHLEVPGGRVDSGPKEYVVKTRAEFESAAQFENMIVAYRDGSAVRVRQLGRVEDGVEEERSIARLNDQRAVSLVVQRQSGTNTVEVAHAVKAEVERLRRELQPQGVGLKIAMDMSSYIENAVHDVKVDLGTGIVLAVIIVFFFLRNIRSTFISSLVIPTSLVGTFVLMSMLGFTQNMLTLLALSLAIGLLIDDAIVVQENIMRHVESGKKSRDAASFATNEIALAVFATTMSVVAVFVPVAFMKGLIGRFFFQFGMTVAFAVLISMFVSFTLDPMLSSRLLRKQKRWWLLRMSEAVFLGIEGVYRRMLGGALKWRWATLGLALAAFGGAIWVSGYLRMEFLPEEDQAELMVHVRAPLGAALSGTDAIMERVRNRFADQPWVDYTFLTIGGGNLQRVNEGEMYVKMTPKASRRISQKQAMEWMRKRLSDIQDARVSVELVNHMGGSGSGFRSAAVQFDLRGTDLDRLDEGAARIMDRMRKAGGYVDISTTYEKGKPEVNVYLKRDRAADLGVSPAAVASTVRALVGGENVAKFKSGGDRYDVAVRLEGKFRSRPEDIKRLSVRGGKGELISLQNVARVKEESGPVQIERYNRSRQITILANLEGKVLGEMVPEVRRFARESGLPPGTTYDFVGMAEIMQESFENLLFALGLAVIVVYMVLAAEFESFVHPFTIMLSLPLSIVGALGALVAFGLTMSIFTMIGIILLMGLVTKNAILLVDYTNTLRRRDGMERTPALLKAGPTRLRPILMTTCAMISSMLPVALGTGSGSESRSPMAMAVIGGLTTSMLLTLLVVPVVYSLIDDIRHPREWRIFRRGPGGGNGHKPAEPVEASEVRE